MASVSQPKQKPHAIQDAVLPRDIPAAGEDCFVSIFCHQGGLKWGMHTGLRDSFAPTMFWFTPAPSQEDKQNAEPCRALHQFLTPRLNEFVFGSSQLLPDMKKSAAEQAKKRAVPALRVYFLSGANVRTEEDVAWIFKDIPVRLFRLSPEHFFTADQQRGGVMQPIMSADRLASLYAAKSSHDSTRGVLIIRGDDTLTYSAMDGKGIVLGGGVSPGINMRFRALFDYGLVEDYPKVDWDAIKRRITEHVRGENQGEVKEPFVEAFSVDLEDGMVTGVLSEVAGHVRNLVKQFLQMIDTRKDGDTSVEPPRFPATVLIEGFDNELLIDLLTEKSAEIIQPEPDVTYFSKSEVEIGCRKNLTAYGIQHLLLSCVKKEAPPNPDEVLRERILGLRGAQAKSLTIDGNPKSGTYRCSVVSVIRGNSPDDDMFELVYDVNGEKQIVDVTGLYDAIRLYLEVGEEGPDISTQEWVKEKQKATAEVAESLVETNSALQKRKGELDEAQELDGTLSAVLASPATKKAPPKSRQKKRDREEDAAKSALDSIKSRDPLEFLGQRVAKYFDDEVFFGVILLYNQPWWRVKYDDGDIEEYDIDDLKEGLLLYIEKQAQDPESKKKKAKKK